MPWALFASVYTVQVEGFCFNLPMFSSFFILSPFFAARLSRQIRRRRSRVVATTTLSAIVGAGLLAGGARAVPVNMDPNGCPALPAVGGFTITMIPDPPNSNPSVLPPGSVPGACELSNPFPLQANVDVDFQPNLTSASNGIFRYQLASSVGAFLDARVDSDTDGIGGTTSVFKEIFGDSSFSPSALIGSGTSTNGSQVAIPLSNQTLTTIWVRDTYSASGSTALDNMSNTFRTPGPLPVLGAGAAFGFSRKLRARVKAVRNA
jgi:hypothetical protein